MCHRHAADLVPSALAPSDARTIVRSVCRELNATDVTDTAALLTSELVTNAVRHARGPMHLAVALAHERLVVTVYDADPAPPQPQSSGPRQVGGRGLTLVEKLSEDWGYRRTSDSGKAVWFALRPRHPAVPSGGCDCDISEVRHDVNRPLPIPSSRNAS